MFSFLFFAALCVSCLAEPQTNPKYVFKSPSVGDESGGTLFITKNYGRITTIKVWELSNNHITGIETCHGDICDGRAGHSYHALHKIELFDGEVIAQVSGKYNRHFIFQLIFVTSKGRSLIVGQPREDSFNLYAPRPKPQYFVLSGHYNSEGITSIRAHWK